MQSLVIFNKHALLKVIQVRNNYAPWISAETKNLQKVRDRLKKEAIDEQSESKFREYKKIRNKIVSKLKTDKISYYKTKFYRQNPSTSDLWKQANDFLNTSSRSYSNTPSLILHNGKIHSNPRDMANTINNAFIGKVDKLCEKVTHSTVEMCPIDRLRKFLVNKGGPLNQFE